MQSYPQSPVQNMTPQRPWSLIYGVSFGVILSLLNIILFYVLNTLFRHMEYEIFNYIDDLLDTLFFLLYFSACLVMGILAARKTRYASSATLASLLIGLLFILGQIILQLTYNQSIFLALDAHGLQPLPQGVDLIALDITFDLYIYFPIPFLGIYVCSLGGLIGRPTERTRRTVGICYAISVILTISAVLSFIENYILLSTPPAFALFISITLIFIASASGMVAWIMTLTRFAQAQSWGAFTLTFFFGGIMVLDYLIAGAHPRQPMQPGQYVILTPGAYVPVVGAYPPMQSVPARPPQPDAISLLQQRFARGEIDAETYRQMLATLTNPPRP